MQSPGSRSVNKGLAPRTPPQLSPVKPRRSNSAYAEAPLQSDVAALTAELRKLERDDGAIPSSSDKSVGRAAVDWERLPLDVWDVVWRELDLTARMALCLTSARCAVSALLQEVWLSVALCSPFKVPFAHQSQAAALSACICADPTPAGLGSFYLMFRVRFVCISACKRPVPVRIRFWGRFHGQTVRFLCESELRVANASFAVDVRQGVLLHPSSTVFLRVRAAQSSCTLATLCRCRVLSLHLRAAAAHSWA